MRNRVSRIMRSGVFTVVGNVTLYLTPHSPLRFRRGDVLHSGSFHNNGVSLNDIFLAIIPFTNEYGYEPSN